MSKSTQVTPPLVGNRGARRAPILSPVVLLIALRVLWLASLVLLVLGISAAAQPVLLCVALSGALIIGAEALLGATRLALHLRRCQRFSSHYLRIRLPHPQTSDPHPPAHGAELFRALHQLPSLEKGWLALTLSAWPDQPVTFGATLTNGIGGLNWGAAFRQLISGQDATALIDRCSDPLSKALLMAGPGASLGWCELGLALPPSYPLRTPEHAGADMLAPLLAALRPGSGMTYAEAHLVPVPRHDWGSEFGGWRVGLRRRLLQLQARDVYGLAAEAQTLQSKHNGPAFDTTLRLLVVAADRPTANQKLNELCAAFGQYVAPTGNAAQRLVVIKRGMCAVPREGALHARGTLRQLLRRAPRPRPAAPVLLPLPLWRAPAILGADELAGLWHLPDRAHAVLAEWLPCRVILAPPQSFIPGLEERGANNTTGEHQQMLAAARATGRIVLGYGMRADGRQSPVGPSTRDLRTLLHLTAGMGSGKSRLLCNICNQLFPTGFTLIDGKGDDQGNLVNTMLRYIEPIDEARVALLDISDTQWPICLNPLAASATTSHDQLAAHIQSIFARVDPEGWAAAPGMQQFLDMGTRLVIDSEPQPTIAHIKHALLDESYRRVLLAACREPEVRAFWQLVFPASSEQQKSSLNALLRRFDKLLGSDLVRHLVAGAQPTFSFSEAFEQRLIVLAPIPHIGYGHLAATAAMLMFQALLRAAFARPGSVLERADYPLVVDEFQVLVANGATQDVAAALTQLRSQGIPAIFAHQALEQIGDLANLMLLNAEQRVILRTQEPDASVYARQYADLRATDISGQVATEHQYLKLTRDGLPLGPFSIEPLPWPAPPTRAVPSYRGPAWQTIVPPLGSAADPGLSRDEGFGQRSDQQLTNYDHSVAHMIHSHPYSAETAEQLAGAAPDAWQLLMSRWTAIADAQRRYILANPGCIPDPVERIRWLSRLRFARPRLLAEAEFRRIRR